MAEDKKVPPCKVGDLVENQEVISSGKKNDGVVKYNGYIVFVNDCKVGDKVTFRMEKIFEKFGIGKKEANEEDITGE